VILHLYAG
jgi:hypothetical protein